MTLYGTKSASCVVSPRGLGKRPGQDHPGDIHLERLAHYAEGTDSFT